MSPKTDFTMEHIGQVLGILQRSIVAESQRLHGWMFCEFDYKQNNVLPDAAQMREFSLEERWGAQQGDLPAQYSMIRIDTPNVILETIKKAEDSNDIILRMYDAYC